MVTKEITFTDYDGNEQTETYRFHLSKAEVLRMNLVTEGGLKQKVEKLVAEQATNPEPLIEFFETLILKSYGKKSEDGRRFIKSEELSKEFSQTEAYSELFMELTGNPEVAAAFFNGVIAGDSNPSAMSEAARQVLQEANAKLLPGA